MYVAGRIVYIYSLDMNVRNREKSSDMHKLASIKGVSSALIGKQNNL